jgi:hypothetical protein
MKTLVQAIVVCLPVLVLLAVIQDAHRFNSNALTTIGEITTDTVTVRTTTRESTYGRSSSSSEVRVSYRYTVDGTDYIRRGKLSRVPLSKSVTVYYDPRNPSNSSLQKKRADVPAILLACYTFALVVTMIREAGHARRIVGLSFLAAAGLIILASLVYSGIKSDPGYFMGGLLVGALLSLLAFLMLRSSRY